MQQKNPIQSLEPGDGLIFTGTGPFSDIEKIKLASPATHFEVYIGGGKTVTSKFGTGVGMYDLDITDLYRIIRPSGPFDLDGAIMRFKQTIMGRPYGYKALLNFVEDGVPDDGIFCSETGTLFYRGGDFEPFNISIRANKVAPMHFLYAGESVFKIIWQAE